MQAVRLAHPKRQQAFEDQMMTQLKNSFSDDLEQIRTGQLAVLEDIDAIRDRQTELSKDTEAILDKIQKDALSAIHGIEQIQQQKSGEQNEQ